MIKKLLGAAAMAAIACSVVPVQAAKMSGGGCSGTNLAKTETMIETMADGESKLTAQKEISAAQDAMLSGKMGACGMHLSKTMHQRALQPRWERRRLATQAQRTSGSLKLHEVMTKPDREPVQSFGARTSYEIHEPKAEPTISAASVDPSADVVEVPQPPVTEPKAEPVIGTAPVDPSADIVQVPAPPVIEPKAEPTISAASVDPSADVVEVPQPPVIEPKAEPVIGAAPVDPSADIVQVPAPPVIEPKVSPPPVIENKPVPITRSHDALTVVMVMVALVAFSVLGLIEFLFRPTFAKRVLAFGAIPSAKKFTFGEMRAAGVRGVLIYCRDYRCSQWTRLDADRWSDGVRLSDVETGLVCTACGKRGADVRPDFNWARKSVEMMGYR